MTTRILAVVALVLVLAGCKAKADPLRSAPSSNPRVTVDLLFEHEGVRVYRFEDDGRSHYYAVAGSGSTTFSSWSESCGKNCTRTVTDEIQTVRLR